MVKECIADYLLTMDLYFRGVYNVLYSFILSVACVGVCVLCDMEVLRCGIWCVVSWVCCSVFSLPVCLWPGVIKNEYTI